MKNISTHNLVTADCRHISSHQDYQHQLQPSVDTLLDKLPAKVLLPLSPGQGAEGGHGLGQQHLHVLSSVG